MYSNTVELKILQFYRFSLCIFILNKSFPVLKIPVLFFNFTKMHSDFTSRDFQPSFSF